VTVTLKTCVDISGWVGALLILGAFSLLSNGKLQARSALYQWMNVVGAMGLIVNSGWNTAWPSVALNVVWLGIAAYALRCNRRSG
jgi:hypothetical protein